MQSVPVVITGLGLATPLGNGLAMTWNSLLDGKFITEHSRVPGLEIGAQHRIHTLIECAGREAIGDSRWGEGELRDAALVVGTSKGPIEAWLASVESLTSGFGLADVATQAAKSLALGGGPRLTISAACASGLHALIRAALLIQSGEVRRVLVIAAESSLHPLFLGSFQRLGVLPPEGVGCRPFDQARAGFLVSEAAAAVCLEAADEKPARSYAQIDTFALRGDAVHLTGGDASGATLRRLLSRVVDGRRLDLIHAHGTGTVLNDPVELAAIRSIAGDSHSVLYSHKGALGHSLGASGLISIVLNCLCHACGVTPGNVCSPHPLEMTGLHFSSKPIHLPIRRSLAMAMGFGGAMAAVSLVSGDNLL